MFTDCLSKSRPSSSYLRLHSFNIGIVISIPILMLWNVRIPLRQKSILIGIFSVTVVVIIVAIIRVAMINDGNGNIDLSWLLFWSNVEVSTCMYPPPTYSYTSIHTTKSEVPDDWLEHSHHHRMCFIISPALCHRPKSASIS